MASALERALLALLPAPQWRRHPVPWLLCASFALNVTALLIPFLDFRRGLSTTDYSLPHSVEMLWDKGLYVLAAVIVVFSVVFPFAKLGLMTAMVCGRVPKKRERATLDFVERYGKWSMLDVFIVCLMIALANDQLLIGARPRIGILCFTAAIVISMSCSEWMSARASAGERKRPERIRSPLVFAFGQFALLVLLSAALCVPFLQISDWLLADRPISILGAILGLWETDARALACVVATFLVLAPLLSNLFSIVALVRQGRGRDARFWRAAVDVLRRWEMLDVFALALGIFLVEGRAFVRTELAWGAFLLALLLALYWPASALYHRRTLR